MSFFSFLHRKKSTSVLIIDIGSASVAGAYIRVDTNKQATIHFTARVPLQMRNDEDVLSSMERALSKLTNILLRDGAPALSHAVGNAKIDSVFVSVASPWQETKVHVEEVSHKRSFRFTSSFMNELISTKTKTVRDDYIHTNKLVTSVILNGYEVFHPFGKMVHSASVVVLSNSLSCELIKKVSNTLRNVFHTNKINFVAFAPVAFLALRDLYPHQKNFLIIDVTGESTDLVLVQQGILVETVSIPYGLNFLRRAAVNAGIASSTAEPLRTVEEAVLVDVHHNKRFATQSKKACDKWINEVTGALQLLSTHYALTHATFLLVDETSRGFIKRLLDETKFHLNNSFDESLSVILIDPSKFANYVMHRGAARGDAFISILALYVAREHNVQFTSDPVHFLTSAT